MKMYSAKLSNKNTLMHKTVNIITSLYIKVKVLLQKHWYKNSASLLLLLTSFLTSLTMAIPIFYVLWRSLFAGSQRWLRLLDTRIPMLLWNTLSLAFFVTFFSIAIGVSLAFLIQRFDFPGRKLFSWLLALPLLIPPYVGAVTYIVLLGPTGWLRQVWDTTFFNIYSFWGVSFVLIMFCFPYVYLITSSSLKKMSISFEEAGRIQGLSPTSVFFKVTLPLLKPAIGASGILVFLYVLSDFGAISILRYNTFTSAIYYQMGSYDNLSASILSIVLISITLIVIWLEYLSRKKQKFYQSTRSNKNRELIKTRTFKWGILTFTSVIFLLSTALPLLVLLYWSSYGIFTGALNSSFLGYLFNSFKVSTIAALVAMIVSLPVVYLSSRYSSLFTKTMYQLSYSGYALPGVIVALSIIFIFNQYIPWLYNTFYLLSIAYIIRFLPQSMQSQNASLSQVSLSIDEASKSLGYNTTKTLFKTIIPIIKPGILAGGALVFVSSMKELPATLLLRPPGFDTLAVRIWVEASEAMYYMAAPAALLIVVLGIIPLKIMLNKY